MQSPGDVIAELREVFLEVNPHLRPKREESYELEKTVEDGAVVKRRKIAPGTNTVYGLFGRPRQRGN